MPAWLQLLIVSAVVAACALYSAATLLPRSARVGIATGLAGLLPSGLARLRAALQAYALRHGASGACGGCGSCAAQPSTAPAGAAPPAVQRMHWHPRSPR